jgi:hypothetical protein
MTRDISQEVFRGRPSDKTVADFFQAIGQSLTLWQRVEFAMLEIAKVAIHPEMPGAFMAAFHAVQHTQSQLRMTSAAVEFWFSAEPALSVPLKTQWFGESGRKGLHKKIDNHLSTRNAIAHFSTYVEAQTPIEHEKIYLEPSMTDTRYPSGQSKSRYTVVQIRDAGKRFMALSREMLRFSSAMAQLELQRGLHPPKHT